MENQTTVTEFVLLGFSNQRELQILHFVVFLSIYLLALMGNLLLILTVVQNRHLHRPMYFFLVNLSFLDACYISVTVPKSMVNSVTSKTLISFSGCVCQVFLVTVLAATELFLLTVMAYDRYVAICRPLQYLLIMNWKACQQMAAAAWSSGLINGVLYTANTFRLHFCSSNAIGEFFCDVPQLLKISCTNIEANIWHTIINAAIMDLFCFSVVLTSYVYIFSTVFRIQSSHGRYKALNTCIPHLMVFCLFVTTAIFCYLKPNALSSPLTDLLGAVLYTVVPPLMNPIIYSLRNREIQKALRKLFDFLKVLL